MNEPPICECGCGEPMCWQLDKRLKKGGHWRCRAKGREYARRWRETNAERYRSNVLRWYWANFEKRREENRLWRQGNPDRVKENNARRLFAGDIYLGTVGFTKREMEGMLNGSSE